MCEVWDVVEMVWDVWAEWVCVSVSACDAIRE